MSTHMEPRERQKIILERLERQGQVRVSELTGDVAASEMTIRRDLEALERDGLLTRVHGGATIVGSRSFEPPYALRARIELDAKEAIAAAAVELIREGDTVIVDGGTTGVAIAGALRGRRNLTVCTTSFRVAEELVDAPGIRLMIVGGTIRLGERSLTGELAEAAFASLRFDVLFLTASGLSIADGATEWNLDDARVKRAAAKSARRCIVVADATKLGQTAFSKVCTIETVDVLVTDARAPVEFTSALADRDVHVILAPVGEPRTGAPT